MENIRAEDLYIVYGEVQAINNYSESMIVKYNQDILRDTGNEEKKFQIKFNIFQINFYKTLSKFKFYDTIYSEQNLKIFSNWYLPISIGKVVNKEQEIIHVSYTPEEAKEIAEKELKEIIEKQIENKDNIVRK